MYKSEFFPDKIMAEEFYRTRGKKITASEIASKMRYTNKSWADTVDKAPKRKSVQKRTLKTGEVKTYTYEYKSATHYGVYREYIAQAELLSHRLENKGLRGIIKSINHNTGEVEFYTGGYGQYSEEERIQILGIRDAIQKNWVLHTDENHVNPIFEEEIGTSNLNKYLGQRKSITTEDYENIEWFFNSPEWQRIRKQAPYKEAINMDDLLKNANKVIIYEDDDFWDMLHQANDAIDLSEMLKSYINDNKL